MEPGVNPAEWVAHRLFVESPGLLAPGRPGYALGVAKRGVTCFMCQDFREAPFSNQPDHTIISWIDFEPVISFFAILINRVTFTGQVGYRTQAGTKLRSSKTLLPEMLKISQGAKDKEFGRKFGGTDSDIGFIDQTLRLGMGFPTVRDRPLPVSYTHTHPAPQQPRQGSGGVPGALYSRS